MIDPDAIKKELKYPNPLILSIDFDRVIHDIDNPIEGKKMGPPMDNAQKFLNKLANRGFQIYVYTLRARSEGGLRAVEDWLTYWEVPFHSITAEKVNAVMYIDDKGYHFTAWSPMMIKEIYDILGIEDE